MQLRPADIVWLVAYAALLAAVAAGMFYGRSRALAIYGGDEAQARWEVWRQDVQQQSEEKGPVARRVPKSAEPPALVLMRDYFGVCLVIALVLSSVLFGTFVFFVRGVLSSSTPFVDRSPPEKNK